MNEKDLLEAMEAYTKEDGYIYAMSAVRIAKQYAGFWYRQGCMAGQANMLRGNKPKQEENFNFPEEMG